MLSTTKSIVMTNDVYTYQSSVERLLFVNVNSPPFLPMKLFSVIPDPLSCRVSLSCQWNLLSEIGMLIGGMPAGPAARSGCVDDLYVTSPLLLNQSYSRLEKICYETLLADYPAVTCI